MLRGCVDRLNRQEIRGWAVCNDSLDSIVDVSIFVDGAKVAQIPSDLARRDLVQAGTFGDGAHAFSFMFPEPLGADGDRRVSVRFSETGVLLNRGDAVLPPSGNVVFRSTSVRNLVNGPFPLPAPRGPRKIFELFTLFDDQRTLYDLLMRVSFEGLNRRLLRSAVFGDSGSDGAPDAVDASAAQARDYMNELLLSNEFQKNLIPIFLNAYPEKRRIIFVHVPKCAGSDLNANIRAKFPSLHRHMTRPELIGKDELFQAIAVLARNVIFFDDIFVSGHSSLGYYLSEGLIRPSDKVFTIVRDPIQVAISQVNYVMTRFAHDVQAGRYSADTKGWLRALGLETPPSTTSPDEIASLYKMILYNTKVVPVNPMCHWLGGADASAATKSLIEANVEITTTENYNEWLPFRWGITSRTRINKSKGFITAESVSQEDLRYIQEISLEDIKLFASITQKIEQKKCLSIFGDDLRS